MPPAPTPPISDELYDQVPYDSVPFSQTHPSRLAAVAQLFGVPNTTPITRARILEVGCASGGNLIPLALSYPTASILGIDLSARQIADGQKLASQLKTPNLELRHANILDMNESWGQFDYVIAHGVYSWVPPDVQRHLLAASAKLLSPAGLMFISYNVNPGWRLKGAARELMQYYTARFPAPMEKVKQARALIDFLADAGRNDTEEPFIRFLQDESARMRDYPDFYILHEYLEPCNEPLYFHEFATRLADAGLKYLGDTRPATMASAGLAVEVEQGLRSISRDMIELEQFLDLLRSRVFRESIVCRPDLKLDHAVTPDRLAGLYFSAAISPKPAPDGTPIPIDLKSPGVDATWISDQGREVSAKEPLAKAILSTLANTFPDCILYEDLVRSAAARLQLDLTPEIRSRIATITLGLIFGSTEIIEALTTPHTLTPRPGSRPLACPLARLQAAQGDRVFNRRHRVVKLHNDYRALLQQCDGRPRSEIQGTDQDLQKLARHALLIA